MLLYCSQNLLAAIDITFPLSLLSCFAFKGFALSPQCPSRHILCCSTTIIHSFYYPGNNSRAKPHWEPPIPDILIVFFIYKVGCEPIWPLPLNSSRSNSSLEAEIMGFRVGRRLKGKKIKHFFFCG